MNNAKLRLQALGLLDRAFKATPDAELQTAIDGLDDDHRTAIDELVGTEATPDAVRAAVAKGRMDGTMESIALVLTDKCLADCIEQLGDDAEHPSSEQLREVTPGLVKSYGKGIVQIMFAGTILGEAPAANILRDLLKNDDDIKLPPAEPSAGAPLLPVAEDDDPERAALREKRRAAKAKKQEAARRAREQSSRDRNR